VCNRSVAAPGALVGCCALAAIGHAAAAPPSRVMNSRRPTSSMDSLPARTRLSCHATAHSGCRGSTGRSIFLTASPANFRIQKALFPAARIDRARSLSRWFEIAIEEIGCGLRNFHHRAAFAACPRQGIRMRLIFGMMIGATDATIRWWYLPISGGLLSQIVGGPFHTCSAEAKPVKSPHKLGRAFGMPRLVRLASFEVFFYAILKPNRCDPNATLQDS
jgi:hypothetical protein